MQDPDLQPPVNPLPPAVVVLFLAIAGVEVVLSLAEAGLVGGPGAVYNNARSGAENDPQPATLHARTIRCAQPLMWLVTVR